MGYPAAYKTPANVLPAPIARWTIFGRRTLVKVLAVLALLSYAHLHYTKREPYAASAPIPTYDDFSSQLLSGYFYPGSASRVTCDQLLHQAQIEVQPSFHVDDDIVAIADSLEDHIAVDYNGQNHSLTHEEIVNKTWLRMAQSSIWMEHYQVYLTVSRVIFYDKGVRHWAIMSYLRAQIHDKDWKELKNYTINWKGEPLVFPRVFDIPTPFRAGDAFFGPEDPRMTIDVLDKNNPEPVIVFNMIPTVEKATREMFIFRPFSRKTTQLTLEDKSNGNKYEKNWMPFYLAETAVPNGPNPYLHFVYGMKQLQIIKCSLDDGSCYYVYKQKMPKNYKNDLIDGLTGGTNLVPISLGNGQQAFVGFPRTHLTQDCKDGFYRPELMVLVSTSPTHYHLDYLSDSLEFGEAALSYNTKDGPENPCGAGRVMIINSVSRWQTDSNNQDDLMTVTFTVDDVTTQVLRMRGIYRYLQAAAQKSRNMDIDAGDGIARPRSKLMVSECAVRDANLFSAQAFSAMNDTRVLQLEEESKWKLVESKEAVKEAGEETTGQSGDEEAARRMADMIEKLKKERVEEDKDEAVYSIPAEPSRLDREERSSR